jgi:hypothetical protein
MGSHDEIPTEPQSLPTPWQRYFGWFLADVLMYIVVLNLAAELVDNIRVERFSISIFVAVVLKIILDLIQMLEHRLQHLFCVQLERKVLGAFLMWLVVFSSKFLFLWMDDAIFSEQVELGYIWEIMVLSVVLIVVEKLLRFAYHQVGKWDKGQGEAEATTTTNNADPIVETKTPDLDKTREDV